MELNDYQIKAMGTCMPSSDNFSYMMLNLMGEVGELASKVAKAVRKEQLYIGDTTEDGGTSHINWAPLAHDPGKRDELELEMFKEAGDILWQLSGLCSVMGWTLEDIARVNLHKLSSRKDRGVIDGNGDNR